MPEAEHSGLVDFETVIDKILAVDGEAQKTADIADSKKREALANVSEQKEVLKKIYREKADKRVEAMREQANAFADKEIKYNNELFKKKMNELDEKSDSEFESLVNKLFESVITY